MTIRRHLKCSPALQNIVFLVPMVPDFHFRKAPVQTVLIRKASVIPTVFVIRKASQTLKGLVILKASQAPMVLLVGKVSQILKAHPLMW